MLRIVKRKYRSLMHRIALGGFRFFEKYCHVHVTPVHYYSPIPDTRDLCDADFEKVFSMEGVDLDDAAQLALLEGVFAPYAEEYSPVENTGLSLLDSLILYAMVRENRPARMIEIGSGESTRISLAALERNRAEGFPCRFTAIEPYPKQWLRDADAPDFTLLEKRVETVPLDFFDDADILFIDSSHTVRLGGDVNREILEIVPGLKPGALVHWHDILIPTNYWKDWTFSGNKFWAESYLLHAFLLFNSAFRVEWASRYMLLNHFEAIAAKFDWMRDSHRCTSFWLRRTA